MAEKVYHRRVSEDYHAIQFNDGDLEAVLEKVGLPYEGWPVAPDEWKIYINSEPALISRGYWIVWTDEGWWDVFDAEEFAATFEEVTDG